MSALLILYAAASLLLAIGICSTAREPVPPDGWIDPGSFGGRRSSRLRLGTMRCGLCPLTCVAALCLCAPTLRAQPGFGGPGGPGPGGAMREIKLVKQFDQNADGWLNEQERKAAREYLSRQGTNRRGRGPGGPGGFGPPGRIQAAPQPGRKLTPADVAAFPEAPLYTSNVLRTLFLQFEDADWEKELADFKDTDVEVPAKLSVDGKTYPDVGVHFHGASSYMMVGEGWKRSLVLTLDFIHPDQQLRGYRKLNLLNSHEDPSFLRTVLSLQIARAYLPAPKANFVRVAINGECWGVYLSIFSYQPEANYAGAIAIGFSADMKNATFYDSGVSQFHWETAFDRDVTFRGPVSFEQGASFDNAIILTSPNGTKYRLQVDDAGVLSTQAVQ